MAFATTTAGILCRKILLITPAGRLACGAAIAYLGYQTWQLTKKSKAKKDCEEAHRKEHAAIS